MKILITGAIGSSGKNLYQKLAENSANELFLTDLRPSELPNFSIGNLADLNFVSQLIEEIRPQQIYHLAGTFSNDFHLDYQANVLATQNILASILKLQLNCRVLLVGSAAEYGQTQAIDNPIKETQALQPVSIYGMTKVYQTQLMEFYVRNYGLDIVMARTFNLLGQGISERLLVGNLYRQIAELKAGNIQKIKLGNLNSKRDYLSLDMASTDYQWIMKLGKSAEVYNVGSGKSIQILDLVKMILEENNLSMESVESQGFTNDKIDVNEIYADIQKLNNLKNNQ